MTPFEVIDWAIAIALSGLSFAVFLFAIVALIRAVRTEFKDKK